MTQKEFDNTRFGRGDKIKIRNEEYLLAEVDFEFGIITVIVSYDYSHYKNVYFSDCELIKTF